MIVLNRETDILQLVSASAVTCDVQVNWKTHNEASGKKNTAVVATATYNILTGGDEPDMLVEYVSVRNKHASSSNAIIIKHTDGTTASEIIGLTLLAGETLQYVAGDGWSVLDTTGAKKTTAATADLAALALTTNGNGASLIGIEDSGSLIAATTVEAALAEIRTTEFHKAPAALTIATGAVTITQMLHKLDTEAAAASDDLDTITGGANGSLILLTATDDTHSVVVKHLTGNIVCPLGQDITLAEDDDYALLIRGVTNWTVLAFKTLAAGGGGMGAALASVSASKGASLVGIEDSGSLIAGATVEAALAELATVNFHKAPTTLTLATDIITVTQFLHAVDTEAAAASDNLLTISGGAAGNMVLLTAANDARSVVVKASGGNIVCPMGQDITLAEDDDYALLVRGATNWTVVAFKTLAAGGGGLGAHLASVTAGKGASAVGVEDSALLFTAVNAETALAELATYAPITLADPGTGAAIGVTRSASVAITQAGAETNTLAIPTFRGQTMEIFVDTDTSGARTVTSAQRINQAGNTIMTFTEVGDFIKLVAITIAGALRWQVAANDGVALS